MLFFRLPVRTSVRLVNLAHVRSLSLRSATLVIQFLPSPSDMMEMTYDTPAEAQKIFTQIQAALAAKDALV
jgi:hypothetical protein